MRWRFVDTMHAYKEWARLEGVKAISLEEYCLLERQGREGVLAESLILESCIQLGRWLIIRSSDFKQSCNVEEIKYFNFESRVGMGDRLELAIEFEKIDYSADSVGASNRCMMNCKAHAGGRLAAQGRIIVELTELASLANPEDLKAMWRERYGTTE